MMELDGDRNSTCATAATQRRSSLSAFLPRMIPKRREEGWRLASKPTERRQSSSDASVDGEQV